jgi:hypothetical protein
MNNGKEGLACSAKDEAADNIGKRIKRLARLFPSGLYSLTTRKRLQILRDWFWWLGDSIDRALAKRQRWRVRPSGDKIKIFEECFKEYVGRDKQKLELLERLCDYFSIWIKQFPTPILPGSPIDGSTSIKQDAGSLKELRSAVRVLLRGSPGRRPDETKQYLFKEASRLKEAGLSYAAIAHKLLPKLYESDSEKAKSRIKAGINRLKKR